MKTTISRGSAEPNVIRRYGLISSFAGPVAVAVGCLVLAGWLLGVRTLTSVMPIYITMKPNTAFCFVVVGLSLWLLRFPSGQAVELKPKYRRLGQIGALFVAFLSLLTLGEYILNLNLGIDQALLRDTLTDARVSPPGRMSILTGFEFFILGASLFFLGRKSPYDAIASQILALIGLIEAVFACLGYVYGVHGRNAVSPYTPMAVHSALVFILLCLATLFARPDRGLISVVTSRYSGGQMARLILPLAVTLPFLIGWLRLKGEQWGFYGTEFGLALFATSNIIIFTILVWISARSLNTRTAELAESANRYRFLADAMPQIVWTAKPDGNLDYYNKRWIDYTGMTTDQTKDWGWKPVLHPDDLQNCVERWTKAFTTASDYEVEYRFKRASDGVYRWHLGRAFPLRNQDGEIVQWVGTSTDIDDQKRARSDLEKRVAERSLELARAREKLQAVLDAATHVSIIATDIEGLITVFNHGSEQMLGYASDEMVGKQSPAIIHLGSELIARSRELTEEMGKPVQGFDVIVEKARNSQHEEREWTYVRKDGKTLTVNLVVTASHDTDGTISGFLGVAMDVTARKKAENQIKTSARRLSLATQALHAGIWDLDVRNGLLVWDAKMHEIYGIPESMQVNYQIWANAVVPQDLAGSEAVLQSVIASKSQRSEEFRITLPNGSLRYIQAAEGVILDDDGQVGHVIGVNIDTTERKESEEALRLSEERFSSAFEYAAIGMALVSLDGRWLKVNQALCDSIGYSAEELSGKTFQEITHPDDVEADLAKLRQLLDGQISFCKIENRIFHKEGRVVWALVGVSLLRDKQNKPLYFISQIEDISEIKQAMARQRELTEKAQAAERFKSEFLANMSHEIRTPMNGVIGMTGLLLGGHLNREQREFAETIRASGEALLTIINDLLDFSKIEAGKLIIEIRDFDLIETVESTLNLLAEAAHDKGVELSCEIASNLHARLRGDAGRLRQILTNLVGNAIKFTEKGEVVVLVSIASQTETHATVRFDIEDTGIGISPAAQSGLFEPFSQADGSTTRKFGGTGLGLAICKHLVANMEGQIGVRSEADKGSKFWFTAKFEKQLRPMISRETNKICDLRVLVVDDNTTNREILRRQLLAWKMKPDCAARGEEARKMMRDAAAAGKPYGLALLDFQMPEMDGLTLARAIKSDPVIGATHLVMLTSQGQLLSPSELQEFGIDSCIIKPVKQSRLFDCMTDAMAQVADQAGPPEAVSPASAAPTLESPLPLKKMRILLADDNETNRKVTLAQLRKLGYAAQAVPNGLEVVKALEQVSYDVILMDCQMPEMDGYEAAQAIRERENRSDSQCPWKSPVHMIALTAHAMQGEREKCLAAGMNDYLTKPVRIPELKAALESPKRRED